ncbi:tripartite tricarboxylate transporter TctB family protein [Streptomyces rapamycinicus]|uniref:Tripartite tricarboxylate transporter TctB family protein n=2 Tax=Streptomyces rhizosphaericus TaxID=114699 RepID=A0A6G4AIB2_9ACTN|nr:tripartite tricarboxylate transporter TctB family protein [Streptomyces rhizosphaericus]
MLEAGVAAERLEGRVGAGEEVRRPDRQAAAPGRPGAHVRGARVMSARDETMSPRDATANPANGAADAVAPPDERPWSPRIAALLFLAAGVAVLGWAFAIPEGAIDQDVGPRAFPLLVGVGLCVAASVAVVQAFRGSDPALTEQAREEARLTEWRPVAALLALLVGYLFALAPCGYWQSTAVLFALVARVLGSRRILRDALIGLVLALAVYFLFDRLLGIHLPPGIIRLAF